MFSDHFQWDFSVVTVRRTHNNCRNTRGCEINTTMLFIRLDCFQLLLVLSCFWSVCFFTKFITIIANFRIAIESSQRYKQISKLKTTLLQLQNASNAFLPFLWTSYVFLWTSMNSVSKGDDGGKGVIKERERAIQVVFCRFNQRPD